VYKSRFTTNTMYGVTHQKTIDSNSFLIVNCINIKAYNFVINLFCQYQDRILSIMRNVRALCIRVYEGRSSKSADFVFVPQFRGN